MEFPKRVGMEIIVVKECKPFDPVESGQIFRLLHQQKGLISLELSVFVVTLGSINLDFLSRLVFPNESVIAISFVKLGMPSLWSWILTLRQLLDLLLLNVVKDVF